MHTPPHHPTITQHLDRSNAMDAHRLILGFTVLIERVAHACRNLLAIPQLAHPVPARIRGR